MKNKKAVGRPKISKKKLKSKTISVRITKEQEEDIISLFGSVKEFLKVAIATTLKGEKNEQK